MNDNNDNKIVETIKKTVLILFIFYAVMISLKYLQSVVYRWIAIFFIMLAGILIASVFLKEEPLEFFDNFAEWKKAKGSSVMILIAVIAFVAIIVSIVQN